MQNYHIKIIGKVQGVFYRQSAKDKARNLGLMGWVKNNVDGSVDIEICGANEPLLKFFKWCQTGPDKAEVKEVHIKTCPKEETKTGSFDIY